MCFKRYMLHKANISISMHGCHGIEGPQTRLHEEFYRGRAQKAQPVQSVPWTLYIMCITVTIIYYLWYIVFVDCKL